MIVCLALLCLARGARSQGYDASTMRQYVDLADGWLVHGGDDPAYARADFDDSHWIPFNPRTGSLHTIFPKSHPEVFWYRLHIKLAPDEHNLTLHTTSMPMAFEIYVNGVRLAGAGSFSPFIPYDNSGQFLIPIPDNLLASGSLVIALRFHIDRYSWIFPQPGYRWYELTFGQMEGMREHMWYWIVGPSILSWLDFLLNMAIMSGALLLYSTQRNRPEYLWMFLWTAIAIPSNLLGFYSLRHSFPLSWHIVDMLYGLSPYLVAKMYCAFAGHRIGWKLNLFLAVAGVVQFYSIWTAFWGVRSLIEMVVNSASITLLLLVILPWILIADIRRGHRETALLLIPLLLNGMWLAGQGIIAALIRVPRFNESAYNLMQYWLNTQFDSLFIGNATIADILSMFSLALIILIRSNRISRQQAFLESEIANAREVQQVILPEAFESIPGFHIESIYEPAREVGGDFFQIVPVSNESFMVIVGDVAGKGLPAAMLVSVLVGAIRTAIGYDHSPVSVLSQLNERLIGRINGGFSTALVALITSEGTVTIANAGHLSPYLDGREVELPGELPLGIARDVRYATKTIRLEPSSRLTFYSDGVIEAQDKNGQLFGFDRARELSMQPAAAIVEAAKGFGQQDDITVITVERIAVEEGRRTEEQIPVLAPAGN